LKANLYSIFENNKLTFLQKRYQFFVKSFLQFKSRYLTGKIDPDFYQGPDFATLDENLQQSFQDFLEELGINDECGSFIEMSSIDKDQYLYMHWLQTAKNNLV